jgi:hypothetical protein
MAGELGAHVFEASDLRWDAPSGFCRAPSAPSKRFFPFFSIDMRGGVRYTSFSTPSGPLPQGMHTSEGFLVFPPHVGVRK